MKKGKKPNTLAVIENYNFSDKHTDIQTDGHGDSITDPAQRAESVKNMSPRIINTCYQGDGTLKCDKY